MIILFAGLDSLKGTPNGIILTMCFAESASGLVLRSVYTSQKIRGNLAILVLVLSAVETNPLCEEKCTVDFYYQTI